VPETPTTRLSLHKPLNNGSELVNVQQDLNNNWDKVDAAAGFQIVTSGTRPVAPYGGKPIAESDTGYRTYFSNGTTPASASWVELPNSSGTYGGNLAMALGKQLNIGGSLSTAAYACRFGDATGDFAISSRVVGDSASRVTLRADGQLAWGNGTAAMDVSVARGAANRLDVSTADVRVATVGRGLQIAEGTNAKMGASTLAAGTVTVANTSVTANSRIFLTCQTPGGTPGFLRVSARSAGASFTILSSSNTDTSVVGWFIVEP
jgi:hypothetical protein